MVERNLRLLARRRPDLVAVGQPTKSGQWTLHSRNAIPLRAMALERYVFMPQNAWAWQGPAPREWQRRVRWRALGALSCAALRRAGAVVRLSEAIPPPPKASTRALLLPNVLDLEFESALASATRIRSGARNRVICLGSFVEYRDQHVLLEAAGRIDAEWELQFVGPGLSPSLVRDLSLRSRSVSATVTIRPEGVRRAEALSLLASAELAVFPSRVEASPIALLEAIALGVPVVGSRVPGHEAWLPVAQTFHPGDADQLARLVEERLERASSDALHGETAAGHCLSPKLPAHLLLTPAGREQLREDWLRRIAEWVDEL